MYQRVQVMPAVDEIDVQSRRRTLVVANPDGKTPPYEIERYFHEGLRLKNNILIVTSVESHLADAVRDRIRDLMAASKIQKTLPPGNAIQAEAEDAVDKARPSFLQAVESAFNAVFYPAGGRNGAQNLERYILNFRLRAQDGAIESALRELLESTEAREKLKTGYETSAEAILSRINMMFWPVQDRIAAWRDVVEALEIDPRAPWIPHGRGIDSLKQIAIQRGIWREPSDGMIEKGPFPKEKTRVGISVMTVDRDTGERTLSLSAHNAGNRPQIHVAERPDVSASDPIVSSHDAYQTTAPRVWFVAIDPDGEHETGPAAVSEAQLRVRYDVARDVDGRKIELQALPGGEIRYTTDGRNARTGTVYTAPFEIGAGEATINVFVTYGDLEKQETIHVPADGQAEQVTIDDTRPVEVADLRLNLDDNQRVYETLNDLRGDQDTAFYGIRIVVGKDGGRLDISCGRERGLNAAQIADLLEHMRTAIGEPEAPVSVTLRGGSTFSSGAAFKRFAKKVEFTPEPSQIAQ